MATTDNTVALPLLTHARRRLGRGRTLILAAGDATSLVVAYVITLLISERIGPLPAVSAPGWFLALVGIAAVPIWLGIFTAYHLYDNDNQRISIASFDEVQGLFHAMLAGSLGFLILSQGASHLAGWWIYSAVEEFIFVGSALVLILDRPRLDPQLGLSASDEAAANSHRGRRPRSSARP